MNFHNRVNQVFPAEDVYKKLGEFLSEVRSGRHSPNIDKKLEELFRISLGEENLRVLGDIMAAILLSRRYYIISTAWRVLIRLQSEESEFEGTRSLITALMYEIITSAVFHLRSDMEDIKQEGLGLVLDSRVIKKRDLLEWLYRSPKPLTASDLARSLKIKKSSRSALYKALYALENRGLVEKLRDEESRRVYFRLTDRGERLVKEIKERNEVTIQISPRELSNLIVDIGSTALILGRELGKDGVMLSSSILPKFYTRLRRTIEESLDSEIDEDVLKEVLAEVLNGFKRTTLKITSKKPIEGEQPPQIEPTSKPYSPEDYPPYGKQYPSEERLTEPYGLITGIGGIY